MGCAGVWIEPLITTGKMATRFFMTLVFVIALARAFGRVDLAHRFILWRTIEAITVSFCLLSPGLFPLLAVPILLIG